MKLSAPLCRALPWSNVPAAVLCALLQRTPAVRPVCAVTEYVVASPAVQVLRAALTAAGLGAMHSLAGATTFIISAANPIRGAVGTAITPVSFTYNGTPTMPASFQISGTLPPGLAFSPAPIGATIRSGTPVISGTPTQGGTFTVFVQGFNPDGLTNNVQQPITFTIDGGNAAPAVVTPPQSRTVAAGGSVTFTVNATGSPAPSYQWLKDTVTIAGATNATLTLPAARPADAGAYSVVVTNAAGTVTSRAAVLTVTPAGGTVAFTTHPAPQVVATGSTVVFQSAATGATSFQWTRNGSTIPGATRSTLVLGSAGAADAGEYRLVASDGTGSATSNPAQLTLATVAPDAVGRLINLSVLTSAGTGSDALTVGAVIGPIGSTQSLPVVVRAVGPTLGLPPFGVDGFLTDPVMSVHRAGAAAPLGSNDDWGGSETLASAFSSVGGFALPASSLDSAVVPGMPGLAAGGYTVQVSGKGSGAGLVLAELYDASGPIRSASTPRLINVSVLKQIEAGMTLTLGFVVGGQTARTVLVRAVGPTLGEQPFGLDGVMPNPRLTLFSSARIAENDDWGGDPQLAGTAARVGAFALASVASRDAMLLATLPPGNYTAQVIGQGAGGVALVEVYEVP